VDHRQNPSRTKVTERGQWGELRTRLAISLASDDLTARKPSGGRRLRMRRVNVHGRFQVARQILVRSALSGEPLSQPPTVQLQRRHRVFHQLVDWSAQMSPRPTAGHRHLHERIERATYELGERSQPRPANHTGRGRPPETTSGSGPMGDGALMQKTKPVGLRAAESNQGGTTHSRCLRPVWRSWDPIRGACVRRGNDAAGTALRAAIKRRAAAGRPLARRHRQLATADSVAPIAPARAESLDESLGPRPWQGSARPARGPPPPDHPGSFLLGRAPGLGQPVGFFRHRRPDARQPRRSGQAPANSLLRRSRPVLVASWTAEVFSLFLVDRPSTERAGGPTGSDSASPRAGEPRQQPRVGSSQRAGRLADWVILSSTQAGQVRRTGGTIVGRRYYWQARGPLTKRPDFQGLVAHYWQARGPADARDLKRPAAGHGDGRSLRRTAGFVRMVRLEGGRWGSCQGQGPAGLLRGRLEDLGHRAQHTPKLF